MTGSHRDTDALWDELRRRVTPEVARACHGSVDDLTPTQSRRRALDYRAFALMDEAPARVRRLADNLARDHGLDVNDDGVYRELCRKVCLTLAEIYETAADSR